MFSSSFVELQSLERLLRANEGNSAAGNDAFLDRRLGRVHGIFDASLLLLQLGLGCRADFDDCNAADQLGKPLLQFLAIVVGSRVFDLRANLLDAAFDLRRTCPRLRRSSCCLCRRRLSWRGPGPAS